VLEYVVPVRPAEVLLANGRGDVRVSLHRAAPTRLCLELAHVKTCSAVIDVGSGEAASIEVETDIEGPHPHWSPVALVAQTFSLELTILDRYRNIVRDYTGTIRCQRRHLESVEDIVPASSFLISDGGKRAFDIATGASGEWNLMCQDLQEASIA